MSINDYVKNETDIKSFIKFMHKNNGLEISTSYKIWILNNIVQSYELLKGDSLMNSRNTKVKAQINIMWKYIDNWYKNN